MSELRVDNIVDMGGSGAPQLRKGANVTGISTITQAVVGNATINAGGINATGIVTSSSNKFVGDFASGNITAGVMTATSSVVASNITINSGGVNASGIVSATTYYGSGLNLTGVGLTIAPLIYSPELGETDQALQPTIELSVNQRIKAGSGNVSLRMVSAGSTIIENFGVGSSVTIDNDGTLPKLSFTPTSDLSINSVIFVDIPSGAFKTIGGTDIAATNWTFTTTELFEAWVWGINSNGMLGQNNVVKYSSPVQIPGTNWKKPPYITSSSTFWIKGDGTLWAIGNNNKGQLGQNSEIKYSSPVQIPGTTWRSAANIYSGNCVATKTDGTLWNWGNNENGELGQSDLVDRSSPVQVPGTTWGTVLSGGFKSCHTVKTDGTMWGWGSNTYGNLGQNSEINYSSPVQIPGTTWSKINGGDGSMFGIKTDGTLWSWGKNGDGQLGQNNLVKYSSPAQIPGTTWSQSTGTTNNYLHLKTDGTLWAIGSGNYGQLGQNVGGAPSKRSSPVQIPGTTWKQAAGRQYGSYAVKTDGTLWTWGSNNNGAHGLNNTTQYSSPVQVPGTTWMEVSESSGWQTTVAFRARS